MDFTNLGYLKVAAASPVVSIGNPVANTDEIVRQSQLLAEQGVSLAVFPELCLSGYSAEDLFFSDSLLHSVEQALIDLCAKNPLPMLVVGLPWRLNDGRLLNCAAVISNGQVLGFVPKSTHPNYAEFYDLRWFTPGAAVNETLIHNKLGTIPIRIDQLFNLGGHLIGIEICEDLWTAEPPGAKASLAGASILLNLSASNELIAKADYRRELVRMASAAQLCAYVYASAGAWESSKDIVFGGHCLITENGQLLAQSDRFRMDSHATVAEIDTAVLQHDRAKNISFVHADRPRAYRINTSPATCLPLLELSRHYPKHPFVPTDEAEFDARAQEIMAIQSTGLARRMRAAHCDHLVLGLSGGLDSTLAFLVCLDALKKLDLPFTHLHALTLPGPGTGSQTLNNARELAREAGVDLQEISIDAAVAQHLKDLDHGGEHDIVFENAQARERTQILFNYANKVGGLVVGTGDLSELALGWCTFNADHMASYNVNASVPKTMMAYLVRWYAAHRCEKGLSTVLQAVLQTPISPELIPSDDEDIGQQTEEIVGPYELHDFFLFHYLRNGATPTKIFHLATLSFADSYDPATIVKWLRQFFARFFSQQFKRTTLPPGPKVGSVSLSPRGDWRMPDEASAEQILVEIDQLLNT
jgi:NAD+ synthase (glutamine-hydrolysing)